MTVSLLEILAAARGHAAPLAAESAGYLLLAVADHVVSAPRIVEAHEVELATDGGVRLSARRDGDGNDRAEPELRRLLARVLEVSSSVGPALRRAAQRREQVGLPALVRELEVALIPVNRGAAKRALSRLHRETARARDAGKLVTLLRAEVALEAAAIATPIVVAPAPAAVVAPAPAAVVAPAPAAVAVTAPAAVAVPGPAIVAVPGPAIVAVTAPAVVAVPAPAVVTAVAPAAVAAPSTQSFDVSEPPPVTLPEVVVATPLPRPKPAPVVDLTLTPEPRETASSEREPALTKPEPVMLRAKERGSSTPRLGTVVTAQTLPGEEAELTERAPEMATEPGEELDLPIDVELPLEAEAPEATAQIEEDAPTPVRNLAVEPQPLTDPEPSLLPDVLTAMLELHTGLDADEAPTRLREVVTELLAIVQPVPLMTPEPREVVDAWLTQSSLADVVTSAPLFESELVDAWLAQSSLADVVTSTPLFESELVDPALHEALTWDPAPVAVDELLEPLSPPPPFVSELADPATHEAVTWYPGPVEPSNSPLPPSLLIAELPAPSPYAPAVLPARSSDVSELVDSFYVSGGTEDSELRSALKEMAGLEHTPLPHPYVDER